MDVILFVHYYALVFCLSHNTRWYRDNTVHADKCGQQLKWITFCDFQVLLIYIFRPKQYIHSVAFTYSIRFQQFNVCHLCNKSTDLSNDALFFGFYFTFAIAFQRLKFMTTKCCYFGQTESIKNPINSTETIWTELTLNATPSRMDFFPTD